MTVAMVAAGMRAHRARIASAANIAKLKVITQSMGAKAGLCMLHTRNPTTAWIAATPNNDDETGCLDLLFIIPTCQEYTALACIAPWSHLNQ